MKKTYKYKVRFVPYFWVHDNWHLSQRSGLVVEAKRPRFIPLDSDQSERIKAYLDLSNGPVTIEAPNLPSVVLQLHKLLNQVGYGYDVSDPAYLDRRAVSDAGGDKFFDSLADKLEDYLGNQEKSLGNFQELLPKACNKPEVERIIYKLGADIDATKERIAKLKAELGGS